MTLANGILDASALGSLGAAVLLVQSGRTGWAYGSASYQPLVSAVIPGGSIRPGAALTFKGLLAKYTPYNGGYGWRLRFVQGGNSVVFAQNSVAATLGTYGFEHEITLSHDRRWGFSNSVTTNVHNLPSMVAGTYSTDMAIANSAPSAKSPRAKSNCVAFASYSAPPTVETVLIDFDQDVTLYLDVSAVANDAVEVLAFKLLMQTASFLGTNFAAPRATGLWGDSLSEGSGSTTNNDMLSVLGRTRTGRPLINEGLGGQTITQVADRILADPVAGKSWDMVLWAGINDASADASAWTATVIAQINRIKAFRAAGSRMLILNYHPNTSWAAGILSAEVAVNANLLAAYGGEVVDVYSVMNGVSGNYADTVHPNDTGYAAIAAAVSSKMTSQGWAA